MTYLVNMGIYAVSRDALTRYTPGLPYGFDELISDLIEAESTPPCTSSTAAGSTSAAPTTTTGPTRSSTS